MPTDFSFNGIVGSFITHAPLIVGIAIAMWWLFPKLLSTAMRNGSGELFRLIIREENTTQSKHTQEVIKSEIKEALTTHEAVERSSLENIMEKLGEHNDRLLHVEDRLTRRIRTAARSPSKR